MKNLIIGLTLLTTMTAIAGERGGNGGGVHYCPNKEVKVQFFDLYEGKFARPKNPVPVYDQATGTEEQMINDAIKKLRTVDPLFSLTVKEQIDFLNSPENSMKVNRNMKLIEDANYLWTDEGCTYEQLANWKDDENFLYIRSSLIKELEKSPLDMAAFKMHEAIYKAVRLINKEPNSDGVRELNAYLFSSAKVPQKLYKLILNNSQKDVKTRTDLDLGDNLSLVKNNDGTLQIHLGKYTNKMAQSDLKIYFSLPGEERDAQKIRTLRKKIETEKLSRKEKMELQEQINKISSNVFYNKSFDIIGPDYFIFWTDFQKGYRLNNSNETKYLMNASAIRFSRYLDENSGKIKSMEVGIKVQIVKDGVVVDQDSIVITVETKRINPKYTRQVTGTIPLRFTLN